MTKTIDLLKVFRSEPYILALAIPAVKGLDSFTHYKLSNIINGCLTQEDTCSISWKLMYVKLNSFVKSKILTKNTIEDAGRGHNIEYRFADNMDDFKAAAIVALDYLDSFSNSVYPILGVKENILYSNNQELFGREEPLNLIIELKKARSIRERNDEGVISRRKYLTYSELYSESKLSDSTIRHNVRRLQSIGYIKPVTVSTEMGIFYQRSINYLRKSRSPIEKKILEYLTSGRVFPENKEIHNYFVRRKDLTEYVSQFYNNDCVRQKISKLEKMKLYKKEHHGRHKEILLTIKCERFVKNLLNPWEQIAQGKGSKLVEEKRAYLNNSRNFQVAVRKAVNAYAEANRYITPS